jgi:hypothetical protein
MDYYRADEIGKRSLSNLIQDNWLNKNQSVGKGIKNAMSEKMKAFGTRVKRNFTGMNMIKTLTGSNLLAATYGKMTGKSKSDISYFTGRKKPKARRIGNIMGLPGMESGEDSTSSLLQSMFDFMVQSEASKQRRAETERSFREEKDNEEQRRHTQFLRVLSEFTGVGAATKVEEKKSGSILDMLKGLWDSFIKPFKWALDWVMNNKKLLLSIARFFAGPLGVAMLAGGAIIWLAEQLKEYFRNNVPDMKIVSPSEAAGLLQGNQKDIDKFPGGEKALREIIANAPKRAKEILARGDNREILAAGGEKKLKEIETVIIAQPPKRDAMLDMTPTVTPRSVFAGTGLAKKSKEQKWDKEFGPYFDPITGKRLEKAKPIESAPTTVKPAMATPVQEMPAETKESVPTAAPVSTAPTLGKINESIAENNTLNLEQATGGSTDTKPIIMQNNKSNHLKDTPISAAATTRDETPIMEHVRRLSASPI